MAYAIHSIGLQAANKASRSGRFRGKTIQHVGSNPAYRLIDQDRGGPGNRTHREDLATTGRLETDNLGSPLVGIGPPGYELDIFWRLGRDLVGLVSRRSARNSHMQALLTKQVAIGQARSGQAPVVGVQHLVGGSGHDPRVGKDHAKQVGLRFAALVEATLVMSSALSQLGLGMAPVGVVMDNLVIIEQFHFTIQAIASEVHQPPPLLQQQPAEHAPLLFPADP